MSSVMALLAFRVSALVVAIVLVIALVELVALLAISRRTKWIPSAWKYVTDPLTGEDGRLSFTKLFSIFIAALYALAAPIPAVVACFLIASAHGTKVLLAFIESKSATVTTTETVQTATPTKPAVTEKTVTTTPAVEEVP